MSQSFSMTHHHIYAYVSQNRHGLIAKVEKCMVMVEEIRDISSMNVNNKY